MTKKSGTYEKKHETHRTKKSFSLMPEMQETTLSDRMVAPKNTCTGLTSLRREAGLQGRRKVATPTVHWSQKHTQKRINEHFYAHTLRQQKEHVEQTHTYKQDDFLQTHKH